ncbi:MAG: Na+/H+ antiporter subunit E [Candidatus Thermoplasmatota archaeon]|nr:Na+/H+ antiporter subunit E [Candidatus Thermoplasmatota archaeon]MBS3789375.1 Na+/H+ antiporter subunit E [Candidatus Thermoplasmatota archaeon]
MSRMPFYLKERIEEIKKRNIHQKELSKRLPTWEKIVITWITVLIFWLIVSGNLSWQNFVVGGVIAILISVLMYENLTDDLRIEGSLVKKIFYLIFIQVPEYVFIMIFQLVESNIKVAKHALFLDFNPGIVKIKSDLRSDTGTTLLANSITLTPGTLTVDVDKKMDKTCIYVHWIDVKTLDRNESGDRIKGDVERWLKKIFW